jgi:hypothetical protein
MEHRMSVVRKNFLVFLMMITLLSGLVEGWIDARAQGGDWTFPEQLSSRDGRSSEGSWYLINLDTCIYSGSNPAFRMPRHHQYSRFDGETWSAPNNIQIGPPTIPVGSISPFVDQNGNIHMIWTLGVTGPVLYSHAPVSQAMSAQAWSKPFPIDIPAYRNRLVVDSTETMHIVYIDFFGTEPGVYYVRSKDGGNNWSRHTNWIEHPGLLCAQRNAVKNRRGRWFACPVVLHRAFGNWSSRHLDRYSHSLDGGENWSTPFQSM